MGGSAGADGLDLRPLTARSVMLSVLLGSHPPQLPVRVLVRVGQLFDISEGTVRVALSRMAADGEITARNGTYRLAGRLLERATRQDESRAPHTRRWTGSWRMAVVTTTGRSAAERSALRRAMTGLHLAERREGVWLRPDNLQVAPDQPPVVDEHCRWFDTRPEEDPVGLARTLWDLDGWADQAGHLLAALDRVQTTVERGGLAEGFMVSAAVLRHLLADPVLPPELLPPHWPGPDLRSRYEPFDQAYRTALRAYTHDAV